MSEQRQASISAIDPPLGSSGRTSKNASPTRISRQSSIVDQDGSHVSNSNRSPTRPPNGTASSNSNRSPTRPPNGTASVPSAAAVQRALSVTKAASAGNDSSSDVNREKKQKTGQSTPQWPTSPRLKSPPPVSFRSVTGRRIENEHTQSNTSMRRLAPVSSAETGAMMQTQQDSSKEFSTIQSGLRIPGRGVSAQGTGLETVAESSLPSTPSMGPAPNHVDNSKVQASSITHNPEPASESSTSRDLTSSNAAETTPKLVSDKAETAPASRATSTSRQSTNLAKRSFTSLTVKSKPTVEPLRTMTVETETVNSTPQMIPDRGREGGSVRTKASTETIRPKKEKRKPSRKTPSLHAGMNSSKADIFEAKVASAVDEADSSDSDETFVYESNPPESRNTRHHSRTPSANSLASQVDQHGGRGKHSVRNNGTAIGGKKSMKFSSSVYSNQLEGESAGDGRSSTRTSSSTPRHHHIGRHGRNGHASIIDIDSPFTQANRGHSPRTPTARNSRPSSPRTSNGRMNFSRKSATAGYDAYDDGADDERAPLIGSVRINRNRHTRRPNSSQFRTMQYTEEPDSACWPRHGSCFFLGLMITLVCIAMALFIVVLNRPLMDVDIIRIKNVLATEQELMLDLEVQATNPNLFSITVNELDVNIFAESPYDGTTARREQSSRTVKMSFTERRRLLDLKANRLPFWLPPFHSHDGVDEGTDPIDEDPEPGPQKMLLGRIFDFDSPLVFDPSPIRRNAARSVGEIRLQQPGNRTEVGGSARWERVLQHPFELIVRGVIQYQLPLSSNIRSAKIGNRIKVSPDSDSSDGHDDNSTAPMTVS